MASRYRSDAIVEQGSWLDGPMNRAPSIQKPQSSTIGGTQAAVSALLAAFRSNAPGAWSDNRYEQANHFIGTPFIAINTLMKQGASAELKIWQRDPDDPEKKERISRRDPAMRLFECPNGRDDFGMFMRRTIQQLALTGTALTWCVPNGMDEPCEMYNIPTCLANPLPQFVGYEHGAYRVQPMYPYGPFTMWPGMASAMGAVIPAEQIIAIRNPHPWLTYEGYSDLTAMRLQADTVEAIDRARWQTQMRGVEPSGVLEMPETALGMQKPDINRIRAEFDAFFAGPMNKGKIFIAHDGSKMTPWGTAPAEMAWTEGWDQLVGFLFGGYGVMKAVAGITDAASFAQLFAAIKQFNLMSLMPLLKMIGGMFNKFLMPRFHEDYWLEMEPERIDDPTTVEAEWAHHIQVGATTVKTYCKLRDLPEPEGEWGEYRIGAKINTPQEDEQAKQQMDQQKQQAAQAQQAQPGGQSDPLQAELDRVLPNENAEPQNPMEKERPDNPQGEGSLGPRMAKALLNSNGFHNGKAHTEGVPFKNESGHGWSVIKDGHRVPAKDPNALEKTSKSDLKSDLASLDDAKGKLKELLAAFKKEGRELSSLTADDKFKIGMQIGIIDAMAASQKQEATADEERSKWQSEVAAKEAAYETDMSAWQERNSARDGQRAKIDAAETMATDYTQALADADKVLIYFDDPSGNENVLPDNATLAERIASARKPFADHWGGVVDAFRSAGAADKDLRGLQSTLAKGNTAVDRKVNVYMKAVDKLRAAEESYAAVGDFDASSVKLPPEPEVGNEPEEPEEPDEPDDPSNDVTDRADYDSDEAYADAMSAHEETERAWKEYQEVALPAWEKSHDKWEKDYEKWHDADAKHADWEAACEETISAAEEKHAANAEKAEEKRDEAKDRVKESWNESYDAIQALYDDADSAAKDVASSLTDRIDAAEAEDAEPDEPDYPDEPEANGKKSMVEWSGKSIGPHKYGTTQLDLAGDVVGKLLAFGVGIPDDALTGDGREVNLHCTALYGLGDVIVEDVIRAVDGIGPVTLNLGKLSVFAGEEADVLKVDVGGQDVRRLNKALSKLPHVKTHPRYIPHVTICYLKPGLGRRYTGWPLVEGETVTISELVYADKHGNRTAITLKVPPVGLRLALSGAMAEAVFAFGKSIPESDLVTV